MTLCFFCPHTRDLKSRGERSPYRFDPGHRHQRQPTSKGFLLQFGCMSVSFKGAVVPQNHGTSALSYSPACSGLVELSRGRVEVLTTEGSRGLCTIAPAAGNCRGVCPPHHRTYVHKDINPTRIFYIPYIRSRLTATSARPNAACSAPS